MSVFVPPQLRRLYRDGRVIPFVGAGASMSVSWSVKGSIQRGPSWGELVDQAARLLGFTVPDLARVRATDLQILEYFSIRNGDLSQLKNWLVRLMDAPDDALLASAIHKELAQLINCDTFYTTNFDAFLERALRLNGRTCRVVAKEQDLGQPRMDCDVMKFHGDLDHPDTMVLSESEYESRLAFENPMDFRLRSDVLGKAVLFLGYSFRDPNVAYLFRLVNQHFHDLPNTFNGRRAYIIVSNPSDFETSLFDNRNIEVIPAITDGSDPAPAVAAVLQEMRS